MKSDSINKWLSIAANTGVLLGILFLAFELRQANQIAVASTEIEIRNNLVELQKTILTNKDVAELLHHATDPDYEFAGPDVERAYAYIFAEFNGWIGTETAYRQGMVTQQTFNNVKEDVAAVVEYYVALKPYWYEALAEFSSGKDMEVYRLVEQSLSQFEQ